MISCDATKVRLDQVDINRGKPEVYRRKVINEAIGGHNLLQLLSGVGTGPESFPLSGGKREGRARRVLRAARKIFICVLVCRAQITVFGKILSSYSV